MSIRIMAQVWDTSPLEGRSLLIELALADFANDEGKCYPSVETVAKKARCSESWVHQVIRDLRKRGRLQVIAGGGRGNVNIYFLTPDAGEKGVLETPFSPEKGAVDSAERVQSVHKRVQCTAPRSVSDPSIEPLERERLPFEPDDRSRREHKRPLTDDDVTALCDDFPEVDVNREAVKFRDYVAAKRPKYVDYVAAFRNWLRRTEENHAGKPMGRNAAPAQAPGDATAYLASLNGGFTPVYVPDPGAGDTGLAALDGDDDPPRLDARRRRAPT